MPATPIDSALYRGLLADEEVARLFTDSAEVRALLLVLGALARAQGEVGTIPETAGRAIQRASFETAVDPAGLSAAVARSGVPVPALVTALRAALPSEHAAWVHWGATSQDIVDTALVLRLRQAIARMEAGLIGLAGALAEHAAAHADLPMAARTYGQTAVPTSFGAVAAAWGAPLLDHLERLAALRPRLLRVSLSGAAGTSSALGPEVADVRARMARQLDLETAPRDWHGDRSAMGEFAGWLTLVAGSLGKLGMDVVAMTASGRGELRLAGAGGSSTMPQKANPVLPSLLVAIARQVAALGSAVHGAMVHGEQRDGAAWFTEWLSLPQMTLLAARAIAAAAETVAAIEPDADAMRRHLDADGGAAFAEALTFALARLMPRPEAQEVVAGLVARARTSGERLADLAAAAHPGADLAAAFDPGRTLGAAPDEARAFAQAVRERCAV
jgi:3-carboxy-cis,cis-muconate cycloisomerase